LYAIRLDIEIAPNLLYHDLSVHFLGDLIYYLPSDIVGSTLLLPPPDLLYIPAGQGVLTVRLDTWSPFQPTTGWGLQPRQNHNVEVQINIDETNRSRNLLLRINLPFIPLFGVIMGAGELSIMAMITLIFTGTFISFRRILLHSNIRHRLTDSRFLPLVLMILSMLIPWLRQDIVYTHSLHTGVHWLVWYGLPFMIRWSDGLLGQILLVEPILLNAFTSSILFLMIPIIYGIFSLSKPESEKFDRGFLLALLCPYIVAFVALDYAAYTGGVPTIGLYLAVTALPVWILRIVLRRFGIVK
jgi:hypothetical protein